MTVDVYTVIEPSILGRSPFGAMPDSAEEQWRQQYSNYPMQFLNSQWPQSQAPQISEYSGVHIGGLFAYDHNDMSIPGVGIDHSPPMESDVHTPSSTMDYSHEYQGPFSHSTQHDGYLVPPPKSQHSSSRSRGSPHDHSSRSPRPTRPINELTRTFSAPEAPETASKRNSGVLKREGSTDDDDGEYMPGEEIKSSRSTKKRTRIPHTAVERRYRENLNAHLEKLRQAVPSLASRRGPGSGKGEGNEGVKPSKCEILNGAIEHIAHMDKVNAELVNEVHMLRGQIREMHLKNEKRDEWYRGNGR